jgi:hypothetical protein
MAIVLGPELDHFLRGIGDDLKGKTILEEPHVDKKTIVRAVSEQNKVILALQSQILRMKEIEQTMQQQLSIMQDKVTGLEKYTRKVDDIEGIMREKIPLVDKIDRRVKDHSMVIEEISSKVKGNSQALTTFRTEVIGICAENRDDLKKLRENVDGMSETIIITSRQVTHSFNDEAMEEKILEEGKERLVNIIAQQEQHACVQDENVQRIERRVHDDEEIHRVRNDKIESTLDDLTEWKRSQSSVDLLTMKNNQNSMETQLSECLDALSRKMSKDDVDRKLNHQFTEIVDHLQSALSTIENEEADFKCITDSLSQMCESLREKKVDKAEIVALRKQFIQNQVEESGPRVGSSLDNESLRRILSNYITKESLKKILYEGNANGQFSDFTRLDSQVQHLLSMMENIHRSISSNKSETRNTNEEIYRPENSHPIKKEEEDENKRGQVILSKTILQRAAINSSAPRIQTPPNENSELKFPSSNVLSNNFSKAQINHEGINMKVQTKQGQKRPIRPSSTPYKKSVNETNMIKKHSLPAILTSISKTMRPRSNMSKSDMSKQAHVIHKGSYHVMGSAVELGNSSDHFISQTTMAYFENPMAGQQQNSKKYMIRTSIE